MNNKIIYKYLLEHFKEDAFQKYLEHGHNERATFDDVEKEYSRLGDHPAIFEIKLFDTVDNNQMNKLIKNIHNLPSNKYKNLYQLRKPRKFKKTSYITIKYDTSSSGLLADVEVRNSDYFSKIEVLYSSLDSWRYFIEYRFIFKKDIAENYEKLIENELLNDYKIDNLVRYKISGKTKDNYLWMKFFCKEAIYVILERFIKKLHYKKYFSSIPSMDIFTYRADYDFKQFLADYGERGYSLIPNLITSSRRNRIVIECV